MLQLDHMKRIVDACYPRSIEDAAALWHDIKPVKFGDEVPIVSGQTTVFATYTIPEDAAYLLILRVEAYSTGLFPGVANFGLFAPPPPSDVWWQYSDIPAGTTYRLTNVVDGFIFLDTDEFLFAKGGHSLSIMGIVNTHPDDTGRFLRTLVYSYLIGALIADRLGANESEYFQPELTLIGTMDHGPHPVGTLPGV